jgi:hypothetical protein
MWRLYKTGWIDNWIYWITHNYTQLQCMHFYSSLQFSITLAESSHCIFTGCLSPNIAGSVRLQLCISSLKTAARPEHSLVTRNSWLPTNYCNKSKSKSHYDRRPVGQCVLVSSPVWGSWPDVNYCLTVPVLSISGAPSDERSGLSFVLLSVTWTAPVQYSRFAAGPRQH